MVIYINRWLNHKVATVGKQALRMSHTHTYNVMSVSISSLVEINCQSSSHKIRQKLYRLSTAYSPLDYLEKLASILRTLGVPSNRKDPFTSIVTRMGSWCTGQASFRSIRQALRTTEIIKSWSWYRRHALLLSNSSSVSAQSSGI